MADDPYSVLGIKRGASDEEIRAQFRKLAKQLHPDVKPGDAASAERFKKVSQAYEILGDATKRGQFDRGEIDANGEPRRPVYGSAGPFPGGGNPFGAGGPFPGRRGASTSAGPDDPGFSDIFADLFGGGGRGGRGADTPLRGQDVRYTLDIEFMEAAQGAKKRVTMPDGTVLDMTVPEAVTDGQTLRLKGRGGKGVRGGEPGDALVEIRVRRHPEFEREGNDVRSTLPISLDEAVLGTKIEVATLSGRVALTIPKGTSSGKVFRLRGKGLKPVGAAVAGDHLVRIEIVMPPEIDESLGLFMQEWRERRGYNPRKG